MYIITTSSLETQLPKIATATEEREGGRQTDRQTDRQRQRQRETETERNVNATVQKNVTAADSR